MRRIVLSISWLCVEIWLLSPLASAHTPPIDQTGHHIQLVVYADQILVDYAVVLSEVAYYRALASMDTDGQGAPSAEERTAYHTRTQQQILSALELSLNGAPAPLTPLQIDETNPLTFSYLFSTPTPSASETSHEVRLYNRLPIQRGEFMEYWLQADPGIRLETADRWEKPGEPDEAIQGKRGVLVRYRVEDRPVAAGRIDPQQTGTRVAGETQSGERLRRLMEAKNLSPKFVILGLLTAVLLGALHALTPGHGKAVVAAYLVGSKGRIWDAVILGLVVTITHTFSVILLGLIALYASQYILPQDLFPWLGMISGMLIILIGTWLLIRRIQSATQQPPLYQPVDHAHSHVHLHTHLHPHGHHDGISHGHTYAVPERASLGSILSLGIAGGIIPCPDAMIVLLIAVAVHRITLGLVVIAAFSVGLAAVLVTIGVLIVLAKPILDRFTGTGKWSYRLPIASAVVVILLGIAISIQSLISGGILIVNL